MASALETAQARLDLYLQREAVILSAGQDTTIDGRRRQDAALAEIRKGISELQAQISSLEADDSGSCRLYTVVPL